MTTRFSQLSGSRLDPAEKILKAAIHSWNNPIEPNAAARRASAFVTVSRQPGAISFSHRLADRLNQEGQGDWSAWDRELVERVSAEQGIAKDIIEMIPDRPHNWLDDLLHGFAHSQSPPDVLEIRAYKRVAMTIRALAAAGHAIIVGRGGTFITQAMPGAIHLRLIAPLEYRIKSTAEREGVSLRQAAERIEGLDQRRTEFYRRYWPGKTIAPETFTMTLNSAELSLDELVECVLPVIRLREPIKRSLEGKNRLN